MNNRSGMTLVEVVIFMWLSIVLLGGSVRLIQRLLHYDYAHQEMLAAFEVNKSAIEELRAGGYSQLGVDCVVEMIKGKKHLKKTRKKTKGSKSYLNRIDMRPRVDSEAGDYTELVSDIEWESTRFGNTNTLRNSITVLLYPHIRD